MKKNIFLGLMLLSVASVFSADVDLEVGRGAQSRGLRATLWSWVPAKRYITHQTVYGVAGGGSAYTAAHCVGASDGWLRWVGLGGLCGGLWLGSRVYRSLERETGALEQRATGAETLAAERLRTIGERDRALLESAEAQGALRGERDTANRLADERQATIDTQNETITGLRTDVAAANAERDAAVGEFRDSINKIKADTGLHAIALLGKAYTDNETHKLLLRAATGDGAEARAAHIDLLTRQQRAFEATGQYMLDAQGAEIGADVRLALPPTFTRGAAAQLSE